MLHTLSQMTPRLKYIYVSGSFDQTYPEIKHKWRFKNLNQENQKILTACPEIYLNCLHRLPLTQMNY